MTYRTCYFFICDVVLASGIIVGFYTLSMGVQVSLLQIPGYLLIVGFDLLEVTFGSTESNYHTFFAAYLLCLGFIGALISQILRGISRESDSHDWGFGIAGAFSVVEPLSLLFTVVIFAGMLSNSQSLSLV